MIATIAVIAAILKTSAIVEIIAIIRSHSPAIAAIAATTIAEI